MKFKFTLVLLFLVLIAVGIWCGFNYGYVFAKTVVGEISEVKQIEQNAVLIGGTNVPTNQIRSFAVAVKNGSSGEIITASSEDRQWAVAKIGQCAIAEFFPYPPWELSKEGTYHNARLVGLCDTCEVPKCKEELEKHSKK